MIWACDFAISNAIILGKKFKISDLFSYKTLKKNGVNNKFKIITALSVFYDLNNHDSPPPLSRKLVLSKIQSFLI